MHDIQTSYTLPEKKDKRHLWTLRRSKIFKEPSFYFWVFVSCHLFLWTMGPLWIRPNLTHDTLEGISWGLQWQWGYSKHPFLAAWLSAGITQLFGALNWPIYFLAQVAVGITFWAVWKLAQKMLFPLPALFAVLSLEGVFFYNLNSFNFTPDTLQSPLWALIALCFYQAIKTQKMGQWILVGLIAGLGLMAKYQFSLLLVTMLIFVLFHPEARVSFKKPGIYLGIGMGLCLIFPHFIWLMHHQWMTLTYAKRPSYHIVDPSLWDHIQFPVRFFLSSISNVFGLLFLLWPFYLNRYNSSNHSHHCEPQTKQDPFNQKFLIALGFGPLCLTLIFATLSGDEFPSRWSTPYYFSLGILMMLVLNPAFTRTQCKQFLVSVVLFSLSIFVLRMASFVIYPRSSSDLFLPNQDIARRVNMLWKERYGTPLSFIAGSHYLVALTVPYLSKFVKPYFDWNPLESPWIDEKELMKKGGVFIWDKSGNYKWDHKHCITLPLNVFKRFPHLEYLPDETFYRLTKEKHPISIGIAILPPVRKVRDEY